MKNVFITLAGVATILFAGPATAAPGQYGDALKKMLAATAAGNCPADLMGDKLLTACKDQISVMQSDLIESGPVKSADFVSATGKGAQRVEMYKVTFATGQTARWYIGQLQQGKFQTTYSRG